MDAPPEFAYREGAEVEVRTEEGGALGFEVGGC